MLNVQKPHQPDSFLLLRGVLPVPESCVDHGVEEEDDEEGEEEVEAGGDDGVVDPGVTLPMDVAEKCVLKNGEVPGRKKD